MTLRPALPYPANLCYNGCEVNVMTKTEARAQAKAMRKLLDLHAIGAAMTQQLFALPAWRQAGRTGHHRYFAAGPGQRQAPVRAALPARQ